MSGLGHRDTKRRLSMLDVIMLAIGIGFFAVAVLYTIACDRI